MKILKQWFIDMISCPDKESFSTQRTAGWLCLFFSMALGIYGLIHDTEWVVGRITVFSTVFLFFGGAALYALGLASSELKAFYKRLSGITLGKKNKEIEK